MQGLFNYMLKEGVNGFISTGLHHPAMAANI
jgi:hypothetical protein